MCESERASAAIGHVGAGTVVLRRAESGVLDFRELNTRLQIEHGVSELVSGVALVVGQLEVAARHPLGLVQSDVRLSGSAIGIRVDAEDPEQAVRPAPGARAAFDFPRDLGPGLLRVDTHMQAGDAVSPGYDSLIAKVIAHAPTRDAAIETLLRCLRASKVEGVATTLPLHLAVLDSAEFRSGVYDTRSIPGWKSGGVATASRA